MTEVEEQIEAAWAQHHRWSGGRRFIERQFILTPELRRQLAGEQNWRCCYRGCVMTEETASFEHIVPESLGGGHELGNLVIACRSCNSKRLSNMRREHFEAIAISGGGYIPRGLYRMANRLGYKPFDFCQPKDELGEEA